VTRVLKAVLVIFIITTTICCAAWDGAYEGDVFPGYPIDDISEVTHNYPDDTREIVDYDHFRIVDSSVNRSRYNVDLNAQYGWGTQAGTIECRQRFVSSSSMNNIALMMRQDVPGAEAEIKVGYYDAGDGRKGLWNVKTGEYLGPINPNLFYKIRMVLDGADGGRLFVNDSYFADLTPGIGGPAMISFGAGSTYATGETYIDYFRWATNVKAAPGDFNDPGAPWELLSPRITTLPTATPGLTSVTINWTTNEPSTSTVRYGKNWSCVYDVNDSELVTDHSITINDLEMGTTYYFYVESTKSGGTTVAKSGIRSFTTQDIFRVNYGPFASISANGQSATICWDTTMESDSKIYYRMKGFMTWMAQSNAAKVKSHSMLLKDLIPNVFYEYYVESTRQGEPIAQSPICEFFSYTYSTSGSSITNNGDFEMGSTVGWTVPAGSDPGIVRSGPWFDIIMPHSGSFFLGAESVGGARNGVLYRTIKNLPNSPNLYVTAWIRTYELNELGEEEHDSAFCQVGIDTVQDPNYGINPNAPTVQWSAPAFTTNSSPWMQIGILVPRGTATQATVFIRNLQTADGGTNITCFDDVVLTATTPVTITSGPTVTAITPTSATINWTTNYESSSFVQYGEGTLDLYQYTGHYLDPTQTKNHSATISLMPGRNYVLQVGSTFAYGLVLSQPIEISAPINEQLENTSFEAIDSRGQPTTAPWTVFQYDINQIMRFYDPSGQPDGEAIDGLVGPYPAEGGHDWHGIQCEADGGSHFLGAYSEQTNKNGGIYQQVKVTPGEKYTASMRFLTWQDPIDGSNPADHTACAIAIDPTGGTDVLSTNLIWSEDKSSEVNGQWDTASVTAVAQGEIITIFCIIEQRYARTTHLNAIDKVSLEVYDPGPVEAGKIKLLDVGSSVILESAVLTSIEYPNDWLMPVRLYVEEPDRSSGIVIMSTDPILWFSPPSPGDVIHTEGTLSIIDIDGSPAMLGELAITNATLMYTMGSPENIPKPLALTLRNLGGGTYGSQMGVVGGFGLSNIGLLVRITGKVTSGDENSGWTTDAQSRTCIYIDDGSALDSGEGITGVKIITSNNYIPYYVPLQKGQMISVVGNSSVQEIGGLLHPILRLHSESDIIVIQSD